MPSPQRSKSAPSEQMHFSMEELGTTNSPPVQQQEHTPGHFNCSVCRRARPLFTRTLSPSMSFTEAADSFLDARTAPALPGKQVRFVPKHTHTDYLKKLKRLKIFFGDMPLSSIRLENFCSYQQDRIEGNGFTRKLGKVIVQSPAGPAKTNSELRLLLRVMKQSFAGIPKRTAWEEANNPPDLATTAFAQNLAEIEMYYLPYDVIESDIQRALTQDQQDHFLEVLASNPEWHAVWHYSLAVKHLIFDAGEMRTIRVGDINLSYGIIGVNRRYGKNDYRRREIPITDGACMWALERLLERGQQLTGRRLEPHHHLFPGRLVRNVFDPETHMSETGLRKPFEAARKKADLVWFQLNGWRHTAATRFAEAGVPIATLMARMGHTSPKMTAHYTHISEQAQRMAIEGAMRRKPVISIEAARLRKQVSGY
jgi:integrase